MNRPRHTICCIGHITHDRNVNPAGAADMPGGTPLYFSYALAGMPINYRLVSAIAQDEKAYAEQLRSLNIGITILPSTHTVFFENIYGANPDDRVQRVWQTADGFTVEQLTNITADLFHLGPLLANDFEEGVIPYLASKGKVSLDIQGFLRKVVDTHIVQVDWYGKEQLLPYIHTLKVNEMELSVLTGQQNIREGAKMLGDMGVKEVVVTMGSEGSVIYADGEYHVIKAYNPPVFKDATGCGDTYMAGYLFKRIQGAPIPQAGGFASAMAGLKAGNLGPFNGTEDEVNAFAGI